MDKEQREHEAKMKKMEDDRRESGENRYSSEADKTNSGNNREQPINTSSKETVNKKTSNKKFNAGGNDSDYDGGHPG
ncbi:hypothetical protein ACSFXN_02750 [Planococcus sp. 1R117A]|uniref:hypothetical protein n=1 Tax=Planococcus sp. 1R117A TaxID=3447020 RepID=UPI003EDC6C79